MKLLLLVLSIIAIIISSGIVESKKQHNNEEPHFKQLSNCQLNQTSKYKKISSKSEINVLVGEELTSSELEKHELYMKVVLDMAKSNKVKFASIIVSPDDRVLCSGIYSKENPILHSELVAITNCSLTYSMKSYENHTIYSTGEPDSLSASAILYARFKTVVFGSFIKDLYCKACFSNLPIDSTYIFSRGYGIGVNDVKLIGGILQEQTDANFGSYCDESTISVYKTKPECKCRSPKSQDEESKHHSHNSENTHNNDDSFFNEQQDNEQNKKIINEDGNESDKSNKKHKGDKKHNKNHSNGHYSHHSHKSKDGRSSSSTSSYSSGNGHASASASASASSSSSPNSNSYSHSHSHSPKKEHNHKKDKNNNNKDKKDNEKGKSKKNKHNSSSSSSSSSNELNIEKN